MNKARRKNKELDEPFDHRPLPLGEYLLLTLIAGGAFALRFMFNFMDVHPNNYGSCDASEYLRNAGALLNLQNLPVEFWHNAWRCLSGSATPEQWQLVKANLEPLKGLYISGPIFPLFLAASYAFSFTQFDMLNWMPPVFANCVISALMCLFVALTGAHAFNKPTGFLAGLLAAIYPAFIINSGRLYSESFAACLLSFILFLTVRNFNSESGFGNAFGTALINGASAAALQFTRSLMSIVSIALIPVTLCQQGLRKGVVALVGLFVGFALMAAPWLLFQKLAFGSASLIVDRVGHYNFFIGNDTDTLGWLSFPYPDGSGTNEKSIPQLAKESIAHAPVRWLQLLQDKPLRLLKFPWNDFRTELGPLSFHSQVLIHQALLLLAAIGIGLGFATHDRLSADIGYEPNLNKLRGNGGKLFILFVLLVHCLYLLFITVPRYNITAIPELLIFSAAGITATTRLLQLRKGMLPACTIIMSAVLLFLLLRLPLVSLLAGAVGGEHAGIGLFVQQLLITLTLLALAISLWVGANHLSKGDSDDSRSKPGRTTSRILILALVVLALPVLGLPAAANGRWYEWPYQHYYGQEKVSQSFNLPGDYEKSMSGRQFYLLVDYEGKAGFNGYKILINGKPVSAPSIPSIALIDDFSRFQTVKDNDFMREGEWIFDCLSQSAGMRPSALRQWFLIPLSSNLLNGQSHLDVTLQPQEEGINGKFFGTYAISTKHVLIPDPFLYSWEKAFYGVENDHGFSDTRYNYKLANLSAQASDRDLSPLVGKQTGRFNLHLLGGPRQAYNDTIYTVEKTRPTSSQIQTILSVAIGKKEFGGKQSLNIALPDTPLYSGNDLWFVRLKGKAKANTTSAVAFHIKATTMDKDRTYVSPWAPTISCDNGGRHFDAAVPLQPGALGTPVQRIILSAQSDKPAVLDDLTVELLKAPQNPLRPGNLIY